MAEQPRRGDVPGIQIHVVRSFAASRDSVWPQLASSEGLERWLADRAQVDLGADGGLLLERLRADAAPMVERGRTRLLDPGRSWHLDLGRDDPLWEGTTDLELNLRDTPGGCRLEVFQEGYQRLALSSCLTIWEEDRRRWWASLGRLAEILSSPSAP